jgi:hypothetical protein
MTWKQTVPMTSAVFEERFDDVAPAPRLDGFGPFWNKLVSSHMKPWSRMLSKYSQYQRDKSDVTSWSQHFLKGLCVFSLSGLFPVFMEPKPFWEQLLPKCGDPPFGCGGTNWLGGALDNLLKLHFLYLSMALQSLVGPWPLFQFLNPVHSR